MTEYLLRTAKAIRAALPSDANPPEGSDYLFLLYAVLLRSKGDAVTASDVHDAWSAWIYLSNPDHVSAIPFRDLPFDLQGDDEPYVAAIRKVARTEPVTDS